MTRSHTPAPWEWDEQDGSIETPTGGAIAYVAHHGNVNTAARTGEDYSHADARLIAAAPRLLEACRAAFAHVGGRHETRDDVLRVLGLLNEAITSAEGGD